MKIKVLDVDTLVIYRKSDRSVVAIIYNNEAILDNDYELESVPQQ